MERKETFCSDEIFSHPPERHQGKVISNPSCAKTSFEESTMKILNYGSKAFEHGAQITSNIGVK